VSAYRHRHALSDTRPDHVAHSRSPKVVEQASDVRTLAGALRTNDFPYCSITSGTVMTAQTSCDTSRYPMICESL
jgi:hypothetical protein